MNRVEDDRGCPEKTLRSLTIRSGFMPAQRTNRARAGASGLAARGRLPASTCGGQTGGSAAAVRPETSGFLRRFEEFEDDNSIFGTRSPRDNAGGYRVRSQVKRAVLESASLLNSFGLLLSSSLLSTRQILSVSPSSS